MNFILGIVGSCGSLALLCVIFRELGYKAGVKDGTKDGYAQGWDAAEKWIVRCESDIDKARQEIWREEAS